MLQSVIHLKLILQKTFKQLVRRPRRVLKSSFRLPRRFLRRRVGLVFFSQTKALKAACHPPPRQWSLSTIKSVSGEVELPSGISGISLHENLISYPLVNIPKPNKILGNSFFDFYLGGACRSKIAKTHSQGRSLQIKYLYPVTHVCAYRKVPA